MTPPPAASPPALHFLVTAFAYACGVHLCTFTCTTDTPVRLTVHVSAERPAIRRIPYVKRGADFVLSSLTCFVETQTIVQTEPGDTLTHTFIIPFPEYDHTYYWYLTGTQAGVPCESISQIFWHSCPPVLYQTTCHTIPTGLYGARGSACYIYTRWFKPMQTQTTYQWHMRFKKYPDPYWGYTHEFWLFHCAVTKLPDSILAYARVDLPIIAPPDTIWDVYYNIPGVLLTAGQTYAYGERYTKNLVGASSTRTTGALATTESCPSTGYATWGACYCNPGKTGLYCNPPNFAWSQAWVVLPFYELIAELT